MNLGTFKGELYIKKVSFNKAVLWKDRQISLPVHVCRKFREKGTRRVVFEDVEKNERWIVTVEILRTCAILKKEGQEPQFYFPIDKFQVSAIDSTRPWGGERKERLDWLKYARERCAWFDKQPCCPLKCPGGALDPKKCMTLNPSNTGNYEMIKEPYDKKRKTRAHR